jgi:hypothetical protein
MLFFNCFGFSPRYVCKVTLHFSNYLNDSDHFLLQWKVCGLCVQPHLAHRVTYCLLTSFFPQYLITGLGKCKVTLHRLVNCSLTSFFSQYLITGLGKCKFTLLRHVLFCSDVLSFLVFVLHKFNIFLFSPCTNSFFYFTNLMFCHYLHHS